jgi:multisubunit Na+/H+ antiporter MnhE subunit
MALSGAAMWAALWGDLHVRPLAALRLAGVFAWMLLVSTYTVARRVCARRVRVAPAVVAVVLPPSTDAVATIVSNAITLTPGTLTLDAVREPDGSLRLVIHALDAPDLGAVRADALTLHRLVAAAFPRPAPDHRAPIGV